MITSPRAEIPAVQNSHSVLGGKKEEALNEFQDTSHTHQSVLDLCFDVFNYLFHFLWKSVGNAGGLWVLITHLTGDEG